MKNILVIGAGRSATALINYLLSKAEANGWFITVADADPNLAQEKVGDNPRGRGTWLDVTKPNDRREILERNDVVVSLLPAYLHFLVARDCIKYKRHLVTASYVSNEMYSLSDEARAASLIFMGELGLDPGIDHMSAMKTISEIRKKGGKITHFRSYAGGLIAPESDDNPWHYKFTWNPRNVVLAGQGTAQYLEKGKCKYTPYSRLFRNHHPVEVPEMGTYEAYANRDSLLYRSKYQVEDIPNILRGTLRHQGFCDAWNALVQIGLTDGSYPIHDSKDTTYYELLESFVNEGTGTLKERIASLVNIEPNGEIMKKLEWIGLFSRKKIRLDNASPAAILEDILLEKWKLSPDDKDMIILQHEFEYILNDKKYQLTSSMVMKGEDSVNTAMSKLVGLPMGIFVRLLASGKISSKGVHIPTMPEVYNPVLEELEEYDVVFKDYVRELP